MALLGERVKQVQNMQSKLDEADAIKSDSSEFLNARFDESDKKMDKTLQKVLKDQSEQAVFASSVHQTVLQVAQNSQLMLTGILSDLKEIERQVNAKSDSIKSDVGKVKGDVSSSQQNMTGKLDKISADLAKLPTQIPEPPKTDLSQVINGIKQVGSAVQNIPTAKFPDMSPSFSKMEKKIAELQKKLSTRVHVFDIERDKHNGDLVKRITVRTK